MDTVVVMRDSYMASVKIYILHAVSRITRGKENSNCRGNCSVDPDEVFANSINFSSGA